MTNDSWNLENLHLKIFLFTHKTSSMTNASWNLENLHLKIQNILPIFYHSASSTKFREKMFPDKYTRNVTIYRLAEVQMELWNIYIWKYFCSPIKLRLWQMILEIWKIYIWKYFCSPIKLRLWQMILEIFKNLHLKIQNILPIFYHSASSTKFREKNVSR